MRINRKVVAMNMVVVMVVLSLTMRARVLLQEGPSKITSSEPLTSTVAVFEVTVQNVIVKVASKM